MSHLSPCVYLLWSILTTALGGFYFHHLWKFDRLRCLNITRGDKGAFKRFMTYSYLITFPSMLTYSVGFAAIKYEEGFITLSSGSVFPKPYTLWKPQHQAALFPLDLIWALSWGFEAVSHLEELCFWLFLIHAGPSPTAWFKSVYFRIWSGGSVFAICLMIVVAVVTKDDPLKNEAWVQLVGSTISLMITLGILPILWVFPRFIQSVKNEGGETDAVMRLVKFHDLNITRTFFRFLFVIPILLLAVDGLLPHAHTLNESIFWTDFLAMASSVGCVVQSAITLMIFFPRSVELEARRWLRDPLAKPRPATMLQKFKKFSKGSSVLFQPNNDRLSRYPLTDPPIPAKDDLPHSSFDPQGYPSNLSEYDDSWQPYLQPSDSEYYMKSRDQHGHDPHRTHSGSLMHFTEEAPSMQSEAVSRVNPMALYYTSPIELSGMPAQQIGQLLVDST